MAACQIFTDTAEGLSGSLMAGIPSLEIISMQVEIRGSEYTIRAIQAFWNNLCR